MFLFAMYRNMFHKIMLYIIILLCFVISIYFIIKGYYKEVSIT